MSVVITADASEFRRAVGVTAWCVLEELLLDADVDRDGALMAATNVRRVAAQLGVSKDTAARAITRLVSAGVVRRVVAERGERGALPKTSYTVALTGVDGINVRGSDTTTLPTGAHRPTSPVPPRATRPRPRVDNEQTSLFDLPAADA